MGKDKKSKKTATSSAPVTETSTFDPTLAALFASSAGPVAIPPKSSRTTVLASTSTNDSNGTTAATVEKAEVAKNRKSKRPDKSARVTIESDSDSASEVDQVEEPELRPRKRRKVDRHDDLESNYLDKLVREEEQEQEEMDRENSTEVDGVDIEVSDSDLNSELDDISGSDTEAPAKDDNDIPKHETQDGKPDVEADKVNRTVFLGNVSIGAIKSKEAKRALILHLRTCLDDKLGEKIESIRFRSTAFVSDAGPKRAAYAKKELMEETTRSTNAYAVLSSDAAARKVALRLNGTMVLDRHLRVDIVGQPARTDHRRCVFVGNLSFVDEATTTEDTEEGEKKRKRAREPADAEEGLWRVFGKVGKVENVRVVRDKETRISKGFAYVQFEGENAVEAALLMNEKKFPPLLPRPMRVMRAKKDMGKKRGTSGSGKGETRIRSARPDARGPARTPRSNDNSKPRIFEGHRASSGTSKDVGKIKKRPAVKPTDRSAKRGAAFKAGGRKKKREI